MLGTNKNCKFTSTNTQLELKSNKTIEHLSQILNDSEFKVIAVNGSLGQGKTSMIKSTEVYKDKEKSFLNLSTIGLNKKSEEKSDALKILLLKEIIKSIQKPTKEKILLNDFKIFSTFKHYFLLFLLSILPIMYYIMFSVKLNENSIILCFLFICTVFVTSILLKEIFNLLAAISKYKNFEVSISGISFKSATLDQLDYTQEVKNTLVKTSKEYILIEDIDRYLLTEEFKLFCNEICELKYNNCLDKCKIIIPLDLTKYYDNKDDIEYIYKTFDIIIDVEDKLLYTNKFDKLEKSLKKMVNLIACDVEKFESNEFILNEYDKINNYRVLTAIENLYIQKFEIVKFLFENKDNLIKKEMAIKLYYYCFFKIIDNIKFNSFLEKMNNFTESKSNIDHVYGDYTCWEWTVFENNKMLIKYDTYEFFLNLESKELKEIIEYEFTENKDVIIDTFKKITSDNSKLLIFNNVYGMYVPISKELNFEDEKIVRFLSKVDKTYYNNNLKRIKNEVSVNEEITILEMIDLKFSNEIKKIPKHVKEFYNRCMKFEIKEFNSVFIELIRFSDDEKKSKFKMENEYEYDHMLILSSKFDEVININQILKENFIAVDELLNKVEFKVWDLIDIEEKIIDTILPSIKVRPEDFNLTKDINLNLKIIITKDIKSLSFTDYESKDVLDWCVIEGHFYDLEELEKWEKSIILNYYKYFSDTFEVIDVKYEHLFYDMINSYSESSSMLDMTCWIGVTLSSDKTKKLLNAVFKTQKQITYSSKWSNQTDNIILAAMDLNCINIDNNAFINRITEIDGIINKEEFSDWYHLNKIRLLDRKDKTQKLFDLIENNRDIIIEK